MVATYASYKRFYGAIACALAVAAAATASAQTNGTKTTGSADVTRMPSISVTATQNPTEVFEYPGMVTVVGRESLAGTPQSRYP